MLTQTDSKAQQETLSNKKQNTKKGFNLGVVSDFRNKTDEASFLNIIEPLCELGFEIHILLSGEADFQKKCFEFAAKYPENFKILESISQNEKMIYDSSQMMLFYHLPDKETAKKIIRKRLNIMIPEDLETAGYQNFDPQLESGNCFAFVGDNYWEMLSTFLKAYETFKFSYDWNLCYKNFKKINEEAGS